MSGGIALLLIAAVLLAGSIWLSRLIARRQARFDQTSAAVDGEVTNLDTRRVRGVILDSKAYHVGYTYFTAPAAPRRAGNHRISEYAFNQLKVGGTIQVNYQPDNPDISSPAAGYLDAGAERSAMWSPVLYASGFVIGLIIVSFTLFAQDARNVAVTQQAVAQKQAQLAEVYGALNSKIPDWRKTATSAVVRLSATDAGFSSTSDFREVYYGTCTVAGQSRFYMIAMRFISTGSVGSSTWLAQGYAYTPGSGKAADCVPAGWSILTETPVEDGWHEVYVDYPAQIPFYQLTATARTPLPPQ